MKKYTSREDIANAVTHLFGLIFGIPATVILLKNAISTGNNWLIYSYLVFGVFMNLSFLTSTIYHISKNTERRKILQKFDHAAIYSFIAGSYTPFTLVVLREQGIWGWLLFCTIWAAAIGGWVISFINFKNKGKIEMAVYIAMGWAVVVAFKPLIDVLSAERAMIILWWLIAGGIAYTVGSLIYAIKKIEFSHTLWHLFVLTGAICHTISIFFISKYF
jgi:hemolysin III